MPVEFELWAYLHGLPLERVVSDSRYESMETEAAYQAYLAFNR